MDAMRDNPLLDFSGLPRFDAISPEHIGPAIDALLAQAGTDKSKILMATIWLADIADFEAMNAVWDAWVDPANPPARATSEARLATPDYLVEIIVVAAV